MPVIRLHPDVLRVGQAIPVPLRDAAGQLLVARGTVLGESERVRLLARGVFVDAEESEQFRKAMAGKLDSMVRSNALLGRIASAVPDASDRAVRTGGRRPDDDPAAAWSGLIMRASALLHDTPQADFIGRLDRLDDELTERLEDRTDAALLILIHHSTSAPHQYSVTHALLVATVCELAARHLPWPQEWRTSLRRAAFTMNIAMTTLQDALALQDSPITPRQREQIDTHAARAADMLRSVGVTDDLWLQAVERHHDSPPGPLTDLAPPLQLARLVQRADIFAARLAPRKQRRAMAATAAAKAAYLDEHQQADDAGAAIIRAVGIYPPGSFVRLSSGEVAVVLRRGMRANEPRVASVLNKQGSPLGEPAVRDTRIKPHDVASGVPPHEVKVIVNVQRLLSLL